MQIPHYFTARVGRSSIRATTVGELNRFVDIHLHEIDPEKITIIGDPKAKYEEFAPILYVLKKHDWIRFKLQYKDRKPNSSVPPARRETVFVEYLDTGYNNCKIA